MLPGTRVDTVVAWVAVVLVVVSANPPHPLPGISGRAFPCPDDVSPCECDYNNNTFALELVCHNVTGEDLDTVFSQYFPIPMFTRFRLLSSSVPVLKAGVTKAVSFESVTMVNNGVMVVEVGALAASYKTLTSFTMSEGGPNITSWPLPDLAEFTELKHMFISGPYGDVIPLVSPSLITATLKLNFMTSLGVDTFAGTTGLLDLTLQYSPLQYITAETFLPLDKLETLAISGANLTVLTAGALTLSTANLTTLDLNSNNITTIEKGAIEIPDGLPYVKLNMNKLTELDDAVFAPLINTSSSIDVTDNPLFCSCDLLWLTQSPEYFDHLEGLGSSCGLEDSEYTMEIIIDFIEYQCT